MLRSIRKALVPRWSKFGIVRRFVRREDGAAAVEFGMVIMPFLAMMFAIIETAIVFFAGQTLETALADSSRQIMTGQAQTQGYDAAAFKANMVCPRLKSMFDCQNGVYVDVRKYTTFADANLNKPIDGQGKLIKDFQYDPGGPGCIVVVRVMYEWPVWVSLLGFNLSDLAGSKRLLLATAAFRNEPYSGGGAC